MSLSAAISSNPYRARGTATIPQELRDVVSQAARAGAAASMPVSRVAPAAIPASAVGRPQIDVGSVAGPIPSSRPKM